MSTDDFEIGQRVRIVTDEFIPSLLGALGTVVDRDAYTVDVRMDHVTPEMEDYEDGRTGVLSCKPEDIQPA